MKNVMSVDLEDWFCVYNLSGLIPYADWDKCESRVERSTERLLELFRKRDVEATFFVLGWVADRFPGLVQEIERRGHEVATHGVLPPAADASCSRRSSEPIWQRSLESLARATSGEVRGFRAPSFSLTRETLWAVEVLKDCGIRYDSSIFPVRFHPDYGIDRRQPLPASLGRRPDRASHERRRGARAQGAVLRRRLFPALPLPGSRGGSCGSATTRDAR